MMIRKLSRVSFAMLALATSACNNGTPVQPGQPTPIASTSALPAPGGQAPAGGASPAPGGGSASPSPASVASTAPPGGGVNRTVVSGNVFDEAGVALDGVVVTLRSLESAVPYEATLKTIGGAWVANAVPEGVNIEVVARKDGFTARRRVGSFQRTASGNFMNFGAANGAATDPGAAYFLSDYPEVAETVPVTRATDQDPTSLSYKLRLSEALDEASRKRFEDALRVFPANEAASPDGIAGNHADLEAVADAPALNIDTAWHYTIKKGTTFLEESATAARVAWSPDGLEATLTFAAPMIAAKSTEAKYQVGLVRVAGTEPRILDRQGKQLGTDENASLTAYPANAGELIRNVFKEPDPSLDTGAATPAARWAATHDSVASFRVKRDTVAPTLLGIEVVEVGNDTRIELAFSEPMAAYDGTAAGWSAASLSDMSKYTFAVAETSAKLADVTLDGELPAGAPVADPAADPSFGDQAGDREREFRITGADADGDRADVGDVYIEPDPRDAKRVWIVLVGRKDYFDNRLNAIKARVEGVADPAGNLITEAAADKAQVSGQL